MLSRIKRSGLFPIDSRHQYLHRFVRFLYMIRYPHSRQRIGSRGRISFSWWHSAISRESSNHFKPRCDASPVKTYLRKRRSWPSSGRCPWSWDRTFRRWGERSCFHQIIRIFTKKPDSWIPGPIRCGFDLLVMAITHSMFWFIRLWQFLLTDREKNVRRGGTQRNLA